MTYRLAFILFALTILTTACGGSQQPTLFIPNADPAAPNRMAGLRVTALNGWQPSSNGITDGSYEITAMSFSDLPNGAAILADVTGEPRTHEGKTIVIQHNLNNMMAWILINDTVTTFTMKTRTDTSFGSDEETLLMNIAASAKFAGD